MRILRIKNNIVYPDLSYRVCGLCFYVHNKLGRYRNEKQYSDALENVFKENGIKCQREKPIPISFKGEKANRNIPDFIIEDKIVLEVKTKPFITKDDYFQLRRYLVSCNKKLGLIVNFRQRYLYPKRVLNRNKK